MVRDEVLELARAANIATYINIESHLVGNILEKFAELVADYQKQKKEWVGLTDKEVVMLAYQSQENECTAIRLAEQKLKEKNHGNG